MCIRLVLKRVKGRKSLTEKESSDRLQELVKNERAVGAVHRYSGFKARGDFEGEELEGYLSWLAPVDA